MKALLKELLEEKGAVIHSVTIDATVADAVKKMNDERIGAVMVMDGDKLAGIFTERDVLTKVVDQEGNPRETPVSEVMTRDIVVLKSTASVEEAMRIVTERRFRHLPVMEEGKLIGLVSSGDLTRWIVRDQQGTIADLFDYISGGRR
jgi:CBS domain-containing protein